MKQAVLWVDDFYLNNRIFDLNDPISNRDNCLYHYWLLKEEFKKHDIDLVTQDLQNNPEFTIFNDMPDKPPFQCGTEKNYLIIWESEIIKPNNWFKPAHAPFKKIFSWYGKWRDPKYIKYYWPVKKIPMMETPKTEFLCIINSNKSNAHYKELYSERRKAIEYFGDRIHVYGHGYNPIPNKLEVLSKYKFCICFENAYDIDGYVTEKIWDCLQAGTIPIYIGENILVPKYTFNGDYKALDKFMTEMDDTTFRITQEIIKKRLDFEENYKSETWVKTIVDNILQ